MKVTPHIFKVSEIYDGYFNDEEEGVVAYGEKLDIRPKYQREWVYSDDQRDEVIRTVLKGFPLNIFYWCKTGEDSYEMLDGQQRTMSLMEYMDGNFTVDDMLFDNLPEDKKNIIRNYELTVYICEGEESEKLEWFKIINVAGEELTDQELRNAVYSGSWTSDAKRYFSKSNCPAYQLASDYIGSLAPIRQEYLELALSWIADRDNETIETYMAKHQHDENAKDLWNYFRDVFDWVKEIFPNYRSLMKSLPWGLWYNKYHERTDLDPDKLESRIVELILDKYEVTKPKGIYAYLLTGEEKHLQLRVFDDKQKQTAYEEQNHKCAICGKECKYEDMHGDHIVPWSKGGKTVPENLQMLCTTCNLKKTSLNP